MNKKHNMITKLMFSSAFAILLCFTSQLKADWVMDFGPDGLSDGITDFRFEQTSGPASNVVENHTTGHTFSFTSSGDETETARKATIRYEFTSLFVALQGSGPAKIPNALVSFKVPLTSNSSEGVFSVVGTAERANPGPGGPYVFTSGTDNDPNGDFEWTTNITMDQLADNDIVALNFDITFSSSLGVGGLNQAFTFGGPGGLIAAPEPTSAAMIGCALIGLIARRRRKA